MSNLAASLFEKALETGKDYRSGSYEIINDVDGTIKLYHYGTLIYAYNRRIGRPVYEDRYGGFSMSDQDTINQASSVVGRGGQFFSRARTRRHGQPRNTLSRLWQ